MRTFKPGPVEQINAHRRGTRKSRSCGEGAAVGQRTAVNSGMCRQHLNPYAAGVNSRIVRGPSVVVPSPGVHSDENVYHSDWPARPPGVPGPGPLSTPGIRVKGTLQGRLILPAVEANRMWSVLSDAPWNRHRPRLLLPGHHPRISFRSLAMPSAVQAQPMDCQSACCSSRPQRLGTTRYCREGAWPAAVGCIANFLALFAVIPSGNLQTTDPKIVSRETGIPLRLASISPTAFSRRLPSGSDRWEPNGQRKDNGDRMAGVSRALPRVYRRGPRGGQVMWAARAAPMPGGRRRTGR